MSSFHFCRRNQFKVIPLARTRSRLFRYEFPDSELSLKAVIQYQFKVIPLARTLRTRNPQIFCSVGPQLTESPTV